ncbi:LamB/YcsF family protein [Thetidibacter halocola]|uniref:LamB/YcsF family protein n=1 Tax=Thetidibacter halocola TaxID=2827239 RepID=A0A8J7WD92_9RHOB|nr:5-oxoprolinase subunit PxpA [Thetidibacter halocola]MBS0123084.1 LamB/YcsF family protein [Thetidibacter halocola]
MQVDLNADMGESFGPWVMGQDEALLDVVTSANVACGFHAGDPEVMAATMRAATARGVGIGAHPGFADLQGFGRRRMHLPEKTLRAMVQYQLAAALGMARAAGSEVRHLKLHGALSNMASEDEGMAEACYGAALEVAPEIIVMVLAGTAQQRVVEKLGCLWAGEIFADRAYNADATLVDRRLPGAVLHEAGPAAERIVKMVQAGAILPETGDPIPAAIDTICLHGDGPTALPMARAVRVALEGAGIAVRTFEGRRGAFGSQAG